MIFGRILWLYMNNIILSYFFLLLIGEKVDIVKFGLVCVVGGGGGLSVK